MQVPRNRLVADAEAIVRRLAGAGWTAYFAGGCVRDWILGREPSDIDVATSAPPEAVQALFPDTRAIGKAFGVILVRSGDHHYEVATFRTDHGYRDGRRPDAVRFATAEADARRRDFTVNALFYDPLAGACIDHVGGTGDLAARRIRAVGDPDQRFGEDHLRMLRAVRFASTLAFSIEPETLAAIRRGAPRIGRISPERVAAELDRLLLESPRAGEGFRLLSSAGLLAVLLPEVAAMIGQAQPPRFHPEGDVFTHTTMMLDGMERPTRTLAYAVLLHDVGKPATAAVTREADGSTRIRFNRHAQVGADMARDILVRLRLPGREVEAVTHCVRNHMRFMEVPRMRPATLRRLVAAPTFPDELELHRLDCLCSHGDLSTYRALLAFVASVRDEPALPDPWIRGRDVLALGIPPGPEVGRLLEQAFEAQLDGRADSREDLLDWLRDQAAGDGGGPPGGASS